MVDHNCPDCGAEYHSAPQHVGRQLRCVSCGLIFTIERSASAESMPDLAATRASQRSKKMASFLTSPRERRRVGAIIGFAASVVTASAHAPLVYTATLVGGGSLLLLWPSGYPHKPAKQSIPTAIRFQLTDVSATFVGAGCLLCCLQLWLQSLCLGPSDASTV